MSWSATGSASSSPPHIWPGERTLTCSLVGALVGVGGFEALWFGVVMGTGLAAVDPGVVAWMAAHRGPGLITAARLISAAASPVVIVVIVVVVLGWWARVRAWRSVVLGGVGLGVLGVGDVATKALVARPRPPQSLHAVVATGYSLPCGHAMLSAGAVGLVAWLIYRRGAGPAGSFTRAGVATAAVVGLVAVGTSPVALGVGFPSDVLAGWALALLVVCVLAALDVLTSRRERV